MDPIEKNFNDHLGEAIKATLKKKEISQTEALKIIKDKTGLSVSQPKLNHYIHGRVQIPAYFMKIFMDVMDITFEQLLGREEIVKPVKDLPE
jgi:hypothetical protein